MHTVTRMRFQRCLRKGLNRWDVFAARPYALCQLKPRETLHITRPPELVREFIQDCLYSTSEGYFNRHVNILTKGAESAIDWSSLKDENDYSRCLQSLYEQQTGNMSAIGAQSAISGFQQMWHTPAALFEPWFGHAVAKYMVKKVRQRAAEPRLVIYEVGPGNAALCLSIMDYIRLYEPALYETAEYHLIEISALLHGYQKKAVAASSHAGPRVTCHHKSIFDWTYYEREPCFVLAFELLDNLPHDKIKLDMHGVLLEGHVLTNDAASYSQAETFYREIYEPATDPLILRTMQLLSSLGYQSPSASRWSWRRYLLSFPVVQQLLVSDAYEDPYSSEFIPTMAVAFYSKLERYFPRHSLVLSDFSYLPDTVPGYGGPVVQTRLRGQTIACSTYLLKRGLFDIFFPTDFQLARGLYAQICGKDAQSVHVASHAEWMMLHADVQKTTTQSGFNPLIEEFQNVQFLLSDE